jgi:hypothetical protein
MDLEKFQKLEININNSTYLQTVPNKISLK